MPYIDLGPVVGKDGGFGNITSDYVNDGGSPGVEITMSGEDAAKDVHFEFKNLVNDPLTSAEVKAIAAGEQVQSSSVVNGTTLSQFFGLLAEAFAPADHQHDASDVTSGTFSGDMLADKAVTADKIADNAITAAQIADGTITQAKLDEATRDCLSPVRVWGGGEFPYNKPTDRSFRAFGVYGYYVAVDSGSNVWGGCILSGNTVTWVKR